MQAIISAAQMLKLGEASIAVAGGAESMSNVPYHDHGARWGKKLGDNLVVDALSAGLSDPIGGYHMGMTAENIAEQCNVTRAEQDALAVEGHARATRAIAEGRFKEQILPIEIKTRKGTVQFDTDEHPRADTSLETLAAMRPVFKKDGSVTAANASGINDGAAAVVLATGAEVTARNLQPLAKIISWGHAGVEPHLMGLGPIKAVPIALQRAGLTLADIDVIEANEAFAAQAIAVGRDLEIPCDKLNVNGGAIALGHPIGASGARSLVTLLFEMQKRQSKLGLATLCIGGGMGAAMIVERA